MIVHNLGYPRIGRDRETKNALERFWRGAIDIEALRRETSGIRAERWRTQHNAGVDLVPVGDFPLYDHLLETSVMLGLPPRRFRALGLSREELGFALARGIEHAGTDLEPSPMTKWFDTNYHVIRPELEPDDEPAPDASALVAEIAAARAQGITPRPVLVGPLTYLWYAGIEPGGAGARLHNAVTRAYAAILDELDTEWVQIDEPILATDLTPAWTAAFHAAYAILGDRARILLATYFGALGSNAPLLAELPVAGFHADAVRGSEEIDSLVRSARADQIVSVGIVDGRSIWRADLDASLTLLERARNALARSGRSDALWIAPSCSLLHIPIDATRETALEPVLRDALSFADQRLNELSLLRKGLLEGRAAIRDEIEDARRAITALRDAPGVLDSAVRARVAAITPDDARRRSPRADRQRLQAARLGLPRFATTTIGSFPQTDALRHRRREWRSGTISDAQYESSLRQEIEGAIRRQEAIGLDVLVHGEFERTDMVEYFGEQLAGFAFTRHGWVQSYGSRCVKPPLIYGDVSRPRPMTVEWTSYAQSLTDRPVKGMLTGPVTILKWSFVREDQPHGDTALQIALALRDEVRDLERAGAPIIQVDEPALREGMPLRTAEHAGYLAWATLAFRVATACATNQTQIHTHMCYSDFNAIIGAIASMDADVTTIEAARSRMRLLGALDPKIYGADLGPGVYDIHSPLVPGVEQIASLIRAASAAIEPERLWVNPDCGLKTRGWDEVVPALTNMVEAARLVRESN